MTQNPKSPRRFDRRIKNEKDGTCVCGHGWFDHNGFCTIPLLNKITPSYCENCLCPHYKKYADMTLEERAKFQAELGVDPY